LLFAIAPNAPVVEPQTPNSNDCEAAFNALKTATSLVFDAVT